MAIVSPFRGRRNKRRHNERTSQSGVRRVPDGRPIV
jgi:hypothetical protein